MSVPAGACPVCGLNDRRHTATCTTLPLHRGSDAHRALQRELAEMVRVRERGAARLMHQIVGGGR